MKSFQIILKGLLIVLALWCCKACFIIEGTGGSTGVVTEINDNKLKVDFILKYLDTFFIKYPEYIVPDSIQNMFEFKSNDYEHLNLSKFYFSNNPTEVYFIQWKGPGYINVRAILDVNSNNTIWTNLQEDVSESEILRIKNRFEDSIIYKIEQIILNNEIKDSIYR